MKKRKKENNNGIAICDSIVMSVKTRKHDLRRIESVIIAVIGFAAPIMAFFSMFEFDFEPAPLVAASILFSLFYIGVSLSGKKGLWAYFGSVMLFIALGARNIDDISLGFKFAYNTIYKVSLNTKIEYYKFLRYGAEEEKLTVFFVFAAWLLAIIIYFFTIAKPNIIMPLIATFPLIEVGLYNGVEISVFYAVLVIGYWLAMLTVSAIDIGEYSGGQSGFVRKDNLFYPKRNMRFKVTEKCALNVIGCVLVITAITTMTMHISDYERSDEINKKRRDISEAFSQFTVNDLAKSIDRITSAFGFDMDYSDHQLGNLDHIRYKNITDIVVDISAAPESTLYLRDYNGAVYRDNSWYDLSDKAYSDDVFTYFEKYSIYPQEFPYIFSNIGRIGEPVEISVTPKHQIGDIPAPYGTAYPSDADFNKDMTVSTEKDSTGKYNYNCTLISPDIISEALTSRTQSITRNAENIKDTYWNDAVCDYCIENDLFTAGYSYNISRPEYSDEADIYLVSNYPMTELLENDYRDFVYKNYLGVPDTSDMKAVREEYADILSSADINTASGKLKTLTALRNKVTSDTEYSLTPGKTPGNRDFVNYFLLENKKGYCVHFATAGVMLARMAGIPARYATGYILVKDDFNNETLNSDGSYTVEVKDNRSHAWAEVYIDGFGWIPFEFTSGYIGDSITPPVTTTKPKTTTVTTKANTATTTLTKTTAKRSTRTTEQDTTQTMTTAAVKKSAANTHDKTPLSPAVKSILYSAAAVLIAVVIIAVRRTLIIVIRKKHFTEGPPRRRIEYIYEYTEKLLSLLELRNEDGRYNEFAENVENHIGGSFIEHGSFKRFMQISLRSGFGNTPPTNGELNESAGFAEKLSKKIYSNSGYLRKLYIRYILVL